MPTKNSKVVKAKKPNPKRSRLLTIVAIAFGAALLIAGLVVVLVKVSDSRKPDCIDPQIPDDVYPEEPDYDYPYPVVKKPILYLYPEEDTEVTVSFEQPENLTTTYPKYADSWKVTALPNGDLYDSEGKYYYGLYWDEIDSERSYVEGFYVEKDNAIPFLEEKMSTIGLNDRERNEFIMYWLPILEQNEKSFVYFELTEERQQGNRMTISPTPDSLLRVNMHVWQIDENPNLPEQNLPTFERKGFAAVEWGGTNH